MDTKEINILTKMLPVIENLDISNDKEVDELIKLKKI